MKLKYILLAAMLVSSTILTSCVKDLEVDNINPQEVSDFNEDYIFNKVEHTVSAEAMLVDAMVRDGLTAKEAVSAVLADENNSYSKNELKAAALELKRLFGG